VAVIGFGTAGCAGTNPRLCGIADITPGTLAVPVQCDTLLPVNGCDLGAIPSCP
jgi:hypothetical protein